MLMVLSGYALCRAIHPPPRRRGFGMFAESGNQRVLWFSPESVQAVDAYKQELPAVGGAALAGRQA